MNKMFEVVWEGEYYTQRVDVYYVDPTRDRFLIVGDDGWFKWVDTSDCRIVKENNND